MQEKTEVTGQIIVHFKPGVTDAEITAVLNQYNASIKGKIPGINSTVVSVQPGQENSVRQALSTNPIVKYSEPDYIQHVLMVPNDQFFANQWDLANTGQTIQGNKGTPNADIHAEQGWDVSQGAGVKVAIIDTGIDLSHPDLASKVVAQKIIVTTSINDMFGHGTHVAGIIAADTNNGTGVAGVCPQCQLIIIKAMDDNGLGQTSNLATAITWAADNGAKVINMSEGGGQFSQTQADAVAYAWGKGAVIVGAAGNTNTNQQFYPAADPTVVSVAAVDNMDKKASFSNFGSWVNVAAPGESIFSTLPTHAYVMQTKEKLNLNYDYLSGTSMAAPVVSGAVALLWTSKFGTSNTAVVQRLLSTADKVAGTGQFWQDGRIDLAKALGVTPSPTITPTRPVATLTSTPSPTIFNTVPSPACVGLGICPTLTPTPGGPSLVPSVGSSTQAPQPSSQTPSGTQPSVSPNPCAGASGIQSVTAVRRKSRHKNKRSNGGLANRLLKEILKFIQQLLKIIEKLINNQPGQPGPGPTPSVTPSSSPAPSTNPCPSLQPSSPVVSPSVAISGVLSGAPSTALSLTPSTSPSGSLSQSPVPTTLLSTSPTAAPSISQGVTPGTTITPTIFAASGSPVPSVGTSVTPQISSPLPSQSTSQAPQPSASVAPTPSGTPTGGIIGTVLKLFQEIINLILKLLSSLFK